MNIWIENTTDKILYNANGTSLFKQVDKFLSLESASYCFQKEYADTAAASVGYTAFKTAITSSGGVIATL